MLYAVVRFIVTPLVWLLFPLHVEGRENLPKGGYVLAVGPHRTWFESVLLAVYLRRRLHFIAKAEYWQRSRFHAWFMDAAGMVPVVRGGGGRADQLDAAVSFLNRGEVVVIYPEGTRGNDNAVHRGFVGSMRIATLADGDVPVVPVGLIGLRKLNPLDKRVPRPGRGTVMIGRPMRPRGFGLKEDHGPRSTKMLPMSPRLIRRSTLLDGPISHVQQRLLTHRLMNEIARLSVSHYEDVYLKPGEAARAQREQNASP